MLISKHGVEAANAFVWWRLHMKGAMLYVDAGKGHYIPAKALAESFSRAGHESVLEDLFIVVNAPFWKWFCKYDWRFLLHHPRLERVLHRLTDSRINFYLIRWQGLNRRHTKAFRRWYEENKPDFIVSTNFIGGIFLPAIARKTGINIPIYQYAADVFDTPKVGVNNLLTRMYFPTELGKQNAMRKGQRENTISICPFPLQEKFEHFQYKSKQEIRKKLGLEDKFTLLFSFGGEGIGTPHLLYAIAEKGYDCQAVLVGGLSNTTSHAFDVFAEKYPDFKLYRPGFVDNVQEYLAACDIQIGKAGANAVMEAIFMKRPFIVSEVLFMFQESRSFFTKHQVGWLEDNVSKQLAAFEHYYNSDHFRNFIEDEFNNLPITFGSDLFRDQLINDTESYYAEKG